MPNHPDLLFRSLYYIFDDVSLEGKAIKVLSVPWLGLRQDISREIGVEQDAERQKDIVRQIIENHSDQKALGLTEQRFDGQYNNAIKERMKRLYLSHSSNVDRAEALSMAKGFLRDQQRQNIYPKRANELLEYIEKVLEQIPEIIDATQDRQEQIVKKNTRTNEKFYHDEAKKEMVTIVKDAVQLPTGPRVTFLRKKLAYYRKRLPGIELAYNHGTDEHLERTDLREIITWLEGMVADAESEYGATQKHTTAVTKPATKVKPEPPLNRNSGKFEDLLNEPATLDIVLDAMKEAKLLNENGQWMGGRYISRLMAVVFALANKPTKKQSDSLLGFSDIKLAAALLAKKLDLKISPRTMNTTHEELMSKHPRVKYKNYYEAMLVALPTC